jgi:hypothetical protein
MKITLITICLFLIGVIMLLWTFDQVRKDKVGIRSGSIFLALWLFLSIFSCCQMVLNNIVSFFGMERGLTLFQ